MFKCPLLFLLIYSYRHNMQKVVYVLLQQHAEKYWQSDHDDEADEEIIGNTLLVKKRRGNKSSFASMRYTVQSSTI